jgi:hypothetical protein
LFDALVTTLFRSALSNAFNNLIGKLPRIIPVDRKQKIAQVANRSCKVSKVVNLEVVQTYIDPCYKLEPCDGILTDTGRLQVLKLTSNSDIDPFFIARWDQTPEHLDIDIYGASNSAIEKFKNNKDGYGGHHTSRPADPHKRIFEIRIKMLERIIFEGTVTFTLTLEMISNENLGIGDSLGGELVRGDPGAHD